MDLTGKNLWIVAGLALLPLCAAAQAYITPSDEFPRPARFAPSGGHWLIYPWKLDLWRDDFPGWVAEASAGRAQAAIFVGDAYANGLSKVAEDCGKAIEWYHRAADLGSELAAYKLGETYSAYGCEKYDPAAARDWYSRAVEFGDETAPKELAMQEWFAKNYERSEMYACVAEALAVDEEPTLKKLKQFDPDIREMVRGHLDAAALERASRAAAPILEKNRARLAGFAATPTIDMDVTVESPSGETTWQAVVRSIDDARECESNLIGNCRGVARLAYVEFDNLGTANIFCRFTIDTTVFPTNAPRVLAREGVFAPMSPRRLIFGRVNDKPDAGHVHVECRPDVASR